MSVLQIGDTVSDDRYTLEAEIGKGGMQEVYRAFDNTFSRLVAVKVPQDAQVARRFKESAGIAAKVNHPNVAKTLDYFEEGGRPFLVEEFIDGADLRKVMDQFGRLDPHTAAYVLHHLARGLSASHRVDVVHRDLKPSNVMVMGGLEFKELRITDFGIARMAQEEVDSAVAGGDETTMSRSTTVMGALAYMAPEVVKSSHSISKPADVWAIAAMTWHILTGKPPFGSALKAVAQILSDERPDADERPSAEDLIATCDQLCYLPLVRELGTVSNYVSSFGFINADRGGKVFFHTQNVVGDVIKPPSGTRVWYTRFDGEPHPRAIPVVPLRPN